MSMDATLSYQQASARGATPIGQVVALYDTILRDFVRALTALQAGDVETRVNELNHSLLVIAHLQNVLNHERGGEAARQFEQFYVVTRGLIVDANVRATPEAIEKLIDLYGGLRQAWYQAEQMLPDNQQRTMAQQTIHPDRPAAPDAGSADEEIEMPQIQWSA